MSHREIKKILWPIFAVLFSPLLGFASETRVDSMGGLSLVLADESVDLNPFIFGNPAGLALIDNPNRFDLSGQWLAQNSASTNHTDLFYGTLGDFSSTTTDYHGLILSPVKNWVLQLDGDILHTENQPDSGVQDATRDRSRELFRTSVKIGALAIGGQLQTTQVGAALQPGSAYGFPLDGGKENGSGLQGSGGLLVSFPAAPLAQQERLILGGLYDREIIPGASKTDLSLEIPGPVTINLGQTAKSGGSQGFGPEIYFEVPNSFQAVILGRFSNGDIFLQQDSSDPTIPDQASYKYQSTNATTVLAALKANNPLQRLTSLKSGASFVFESSTITGYDPSQNVSAVTDSQAWQFQIGTGLEGLEKYTVGIQAKAQGINGGLTPAGGPDQPIHFFSYQISLGGEQWISKQWAFRGGIIYENDLNTGSSDYQAGFFPIPSGQRVVSTTITTGVGFKNADFRSDLMFFLGQPFLYDSPSPNDFWTQTGFQLAASILFE